MISLETTRKDHLGRYGGRSWTPTLDAIAADGVALDQHRSCSNWTYGAMVCALGGRDTLAAGYAPQAGADSTPLPDDLALLPDWLAARGFETSLVSTNIYMGSTAHLGERYDHFQEENGAPAEDAVDRALVAWDALGGARRFLHVHLFDPHAGYDPPAAYLRALSALDPLPVEGLDLTVDTQGQALESIWAGLDDAARALVLDHLRARYTGELRYLDDQLRRLWEGLSARGALDDALVMIWSDHGEQFGEHGRFTHGRDLHGEEADAVAIFWAEGLTPRAWSEPTGHLDLAPTALDALGLAPAAEATGRPAGTADPARPLFAVRRDVAPVQAVDAEGMRMVYRWDGRASVHDLDADPGDEVDLFDPDDDATRALWALLAERAAALEPLMPGAAFTPPPGL